MKKSWTLVILLACFFWTACEKEDDAVSEFRELAKPVKVDMAVALATAVGSVAGIVLKGELEKENGKLQYSFEILPPGGGDVVKEVRIDAVSGALIGIEEESAGREAREKD